MNGRGWKLVTNQPFENFYMQLFFILFLTLGISFASSIDESSPEYQALLLKVHLEDIQNLKAYIIDTKAEIKKIKEEIRKSLIKCCEQKNEFDLLKGEFTPTEKKNIKYNLECSFPPKFIPQNDLLKENHAEEDQTNLNKNVREDPAKEEKRNLKNERFQEKSDLNDAKMIAIRRHIYYYNYWNKVIKTTLFFMKKIKDLKYPQDVTEESSSSVLEGQKNKDESEYSASDEGEFPNEVIDNDLENETFIFEF
jgi:hypothetical protein